MIHEFGYNPDQPRQSDGKWGSGGGSSSGSGSLLSPGTVVRVNTGAEKGGMTGVVRQGYSPEGKNTVHLKDGTVGHYHTKDLTPMSDTEQMADIQARDNASLDYRVNQPGRSRFAYNPDQPRDSDGKWASGGGGGASSDSSGGQDSQAISKATSRFDEVASRLQNIEEQFQKAVHAYPSDPKSPEYKAHGEMVNKLIKQRNRDEYKLMDAAMKLHEAKGGKFPDINAATAASSLVTTTKPLTDAMRERKDIVQALLDDRAARTGQSFKWLPKSWVASSDSEPHKFASITGAEVFATGSWNGLDFTEADLDGIASAFDAMQLSGRVPLKFGHSGADARDGAPALGWVDRVYRDGNKLMADFSSIPSVVYDAIKEGMYKFVSVELLKNVPANTRNIPWVLDAVALLGASQPAVGILKDLQTLTMSRGTGLRGSERVAFRRNYSQSGDLSMSEDMRSVHEQLRVLMSRVEAAEMRANTAENQLKSDKINTKRHELKTLFERAIQAREIVPAVRESFTKVYRTDDDDFLERLNLDDARAFIKANSTDAKSKDVTFMSRQATDDLTGSNSEVVHSLATREAVSRGFTADNTTAVMDATKAVFKRYPQLAAAYFNSPNDTYKSEV